MVPRLLALILALISALVGSYVVLRSINVLGTPLWGTADNASGVYFILGTFYFAIGALLLALSVVIVKYLWSQR